MPRKRGRPSTQQPDTEEVKKSKRADHKTETADVSLPIDSCTYTLITDVGYSGTVFYYLIPNNVITADERGVLDRINGYIDCYSKLVKDKVPEKVSTSKKKPTDERTYYDQDIMDLADLLYGVYEGSKAEWNKYYHEKFPTGGKVITYAYCIAEIWSTETLIDHAKEMIRIKQRAESEALKKHSELLVNMSENKQDGKSE